MQIYTLGFTQKSAREFFELIKENNIQLLIDIRLNNQSQLAGFTKGRDLGYFLKEICDCNYVHEPIFAPTKQLLSDYKKGLTDWDEYEKVFDKIMLSRNICNYFLEKYAKMDSICLLCSELEPKFCHRRLVAEKLREDLKLNIEIHHL